MIIHKYPLSIVDQQYLTMQSGATILSVQIQNAQLFLWALVDKDSHQVKRVINIIGTGNPIMENPGIFISTVQTFGGALVWHVFDGGEHHDN